jgi:hypothetical protein
VPASRKLHCSIGSPDQFPHRAVHDFGFALDTRGGFQTFAAVAKLTYQNCKDPTLHKGSTLN